MTGLAAPRALERLADLPGISTAVRLALASPFLVSGLIKLFELPSAAAEMSHFGLQSAPLFAAAVIVTQLGGAALLLTRRWCWLGAGILSVFTILATLLAHPFWAAAGPDRVPQAATFFEHVAIVGGLALAAIHTSRGRDR